MTANTMAPPKYTYLWRKYRPAILSLMVASESGTKTYEFGRHEFKDAHPGERGGYAFKMRVFKGKTITNISKSAVAKDLLAVLRESERACELTTEFIFEFELDRSLVLHISRENLPVEDDSPSDEG